MHHPDLVLLFLRQCKKFRYVAEKITDVRGRNGRIGEVEEADVDQGMAQLRYELGSGRLRSKERIVDDGDTGEVSTCGEGRISHG